MRTEAAPSPYSMVNSVRFRAYGSLIGSNLCVAPWYTLYTTPSFHGVRIGSKPPCALRPLLRGLRNRAKFSLEENQQIMEKVCELGKINSELQVQIDTLETSIKNIEEVNSDNICWADSVALDIVVKFMKEEVKVMQFEKDFNKKEMTNLLVQALPQ